jgi:hypothetical protein
MSNPGGVSVTEPPSSNDLLAPIGYVYLGDPAPRLGHLAAADKERALPVCGAGGGDYEEFTYLPYGFTTCASSLRIADEAPSRPVWRPLEASLGTVQALIRHGEEVDLSWVRGRELMHGRAVL